jgi:hypothetical protein
MREPAECPCSAVGMSCVVRADFGGNAIPKECLLDLCARAIPDEVTHKNAHSLHVTVASRTYVCTYSYYWD